MTTMDQLPKLIKIQVVVATVTVGIVIWASLKIPRLFDEIASLEAQKASLEQQKAEVWIDVQKLRAESNSLSVELKGVRSDVAECKTVDCANAAVEKRLESAALASDSPLESVVPGLFAETSADRTRAYRMIMAGHSTDPQLVPTLLGYAKRNMQNANGIYNTLVVLSHLNLKKLGSDIDEIKAFAESARGIGERTSTRVDILLSRLPE